MEPGIRPRGRWEYDDWHNEYCGEVNCPGRNFCRKHRRIYNICQDFERDKSVAYYGGDGECVTCKREAALARYAREREAYEKRLGLPKSA